MRPDNYHLLAGIRLDGTGRFTVEAANTSDRHSLHISFTDRITSVLGPDRA